MHAFKKSSPSMESERSMPSDLLYCMYRIISPAIRLLPCAGQDRCSRLLFSLVRFDRPKQSLLYCELMFMLIKDFRRLVNVHLLNFRSGVVGGGIGGISGR